jgi:hypothetical protein
LHLTSRRPRTKLIRKSGKAYGGTFAGQSGSVTAELVLLLPSMALLFALLSLVASLQVANLKLVSQAGQLARAYAVGQSPKELATLAEQMQLQLRLQSKADWLCVTATRLVRTWFVPSLPLAQTQCALPVGV